MTQQIDVAVPDAAADSRGFASRKWILALLVVALSTGLLWLGRIDAARWTDAVIWVTGLYMAGNGATALALAWGAKR